MEETTFVTCVKGIYCRQCVEVIVTAMVQTRGVLDADILYLPAELTVRYDPELVTETDLRAALNACGYPACRRGAPGSSPILNAIKANFRQKQKREGSK
ncbi:MAG: heavy-metal-associated domain-containing protein [Oscillospiraceae bacterium]|nr:heavy-metal-associated domain-containing protein [Oscillospiraceae bacterium]